ncbi:phytosulfokines 5-like [Lolium rigidum]|uniref:phytosulfokines 5-like n=1 Tax=Lolium rigidum TaxID=89674 RepID=UPI001F5C6376|nr:phytosulfokines 5-like [Lolium rigidum]
MTRRCGTSSAPPFAALALLLLLSFSCCAAAARLLPASTAPHEDSSVIDVKAADAASDGLGALPAEGGKVGNGEEPAPEVTTAAAEDLEKEEEACEEGTTGEECMQRRLLHDAHLDYIYTQRKGRP